MSIAVMTRVWRSAQVSGGALLTLLALADFSDDDGKSYPSVATLAAKARLSERQTQRVLVELVASGHLTIKRSNGTPGEPNVYRVSVPKNGCQNVTPRQNVTGDVDVTLTVTPLLSTKSINGSKKEGRGESVKGGVSAEFLVELRSRFIALRDFDYEIEKWRDHIAVKPPKGNQKNSLRNWLARSLKYQREQEPAVFEFQPGPFWEQREQAARAKAAQLLETV